MPSTYTVNLGIEKPATGEQSGTWGDTTNINFDILDQAINGCLSLTLASAGTSGSPNTLAISDGATSDGRNKWIEFVDGGDLGATAYVQLTPNDAEKIVFIRNSLSGSRSVILFQGTYDAGRDLEVPAGVDMVVKFSGGGATATTTDIFTKLRATEITTPTLTTDDLTAGTADINDGTVEAVIGGTTPKAGTFTNLTANTDLSLATGATVTGINTTTNMSDASATTLATSLSIKTYVDDQVATVDTLAEVLANGNTSGANNLIIDSGQALTANTINETTAGSGVTIDSVLLKDDGVNATNLEITNIKANDGTAAVSIADSTGAVTITSFISNSVDIGGGAIDDTTIGGTTPNSGSFTTLNTSGAVIFNDAGADVDFRVESDSNPYALFVDAGLNVVTVGNSSPENWYSGYQAFQVGLVGAIASNETGADTDVLQITSNAYLQDVSTLWKFMEDSVGATRLQMQGQDIQFLMSDAAGAANSTVTWHSRMRVDTGGTTFNEVGADYDFRVESDTNTHALFVDAGNNHVSFFGTSNAAMDGVQGVQIGDTSSTSAGLGMATANHSFLLYIDNSNDLLSLYDSTNNVDRMQLLNDGTFVFNQTGVSSADFRVESDINTHMLFVDAGANSVAMGTSAPASYVNTGGLAVKGATYSDLALVSSSISSGSNSHQLRFYNEAGASYEIARMRVNVGAGQVNRGEIQFANNNGATLRPWLDVNYSGDVVFNSQSYDSDFRVSSDTNTHMLYVDAGNNRVGVGTNTPDSVFDVYSSEESSTALVSTFRAGGDNDNNRANVFIGQDNNSRGLLIRAGRETSDRAISQFFLNSSGGTIGSNTINALEFYEVTGATAFETTFNQDGGANVDFRVESDGNSQALWVDAENDVVKIGGSGELNPSMVLQLMGAMGLMKSFTVNSTASRIAEGTGGLFLCRDDSYGGVALILYEFSGPVTIIAQTGSNFTTSTPTGTQVQFVAAGSPAPFGLNAVMAAGQSSTLRGGAIICDPS